jgi:hypothetical protein
MRCDAAFLRSLDRLKQAFGVRTRPEVVRIIVKRAVEEIAPKRKEKP